jgi:hypothetical protein
MQVARCSSDSLRLPSVILDSIHEDGRALRTTGHDSWETLKVQRFQFDRRNELVAKVRRQDKESTGYQSS